ncbi:hypothetical protein F4818DRAFT_395652 [Hypoxylon cercidicola]|nr:hypothetical protein F4818DRAFT_395652 [Hypoxylon cercidicola]
MNRNTDPQDDEDAELTAEARLRKARKKAGDDAASEARINKLIEDTNAKIGFRVNEGDSKEENARRLNLFVAEIYKKDPKKDWPILTKAEEFIENMKKQPFKLLNPNDKDDDDDQPQVGFQQRKTSRNTTERAKHQKRRLYEPEQPKEKGQPSSSAMDQPAKTTKTPAHGSQPRGRKGEHDTALPTPTSNPTDASTSLGASQPKKKRRTENLETNLGSKWDVHVDEWGHRPARSGKK